MQIAVAVAGIIAGGIAGIAGAGAGAAPEATSAGANAAGSNYIGDYTLSGYNSFNFASTSSIGIPGEPSFSLRIIPVKLDGNAMYTARVFDHTGRLIHEYASSKMEYSQYMGWFMMPFVLE